MKSKTFGIIGGGSWGLGFGIHLSKRYNVKIYEINSERVSEVQKERTLKNFLPGVYIPSTIVYSDDLPLVLNEIDYMVLAIPTQFLRRGLSKIVSDRGRNFYAGVKAVVNLAKGIEVDSLLLPTQIISEFIPSSVIALSGPSISLEVVNGIPTAVVLAGENELLVEELQKLISFDNVRVYASSDTIGVELGGALKNIIAIASGIIDGMGLGANTKGALLTRGLAEIVRLGMKMGGERETFYGLSGIGDMITTATSIKSRNYTVGFNLGKGKSLKEILKKMVMVAEGVETTRAVHKLSLKNNIEMPIIDSMYKILFENSPVKDEITNLLSRPLKREVL